MSFYLKQDAVAYVLSAASVSVDGWYLVESSVPVDRRAFPKGASLYMRRAKRGERVIVPGDFALQAAPLVIVDGNPHVRGEIALDGSWGRFFAYEGQGVSLDYRFSTDGVERKDFYRPVWAWRMEGSSKWLPCVSDTLELPGSASGRRLELRLVLEAPDGWVASEDISTITILPRVTWRPGRPCAPPRQGSWQDLIGFPGIW